MNWFEEQIQTRKKNDEAEFARSAAELRASVTRRRASVSDDPTARIKSALDEVLVYYGITPRELPPEITELGDQVEYVCHPHGIMHRRVTLDADWYKNAVGAMFSTMKDGEPVALLPGKLGGYYFTDPETGKQVRVNRETCTRLVNNAICFYRPFPQREMGLPQLAGYVIRCIPPFTLVRYLLSVLLVTAFGMTAPQITRITFSYILEEESTSLLMAMAALSVSVTVSGLLMSTIRTLLLERIQTAVDVSVEAAVMGRLLFLPAGFFRAYSPGNLSERVQGVQRFCTCVVSAVLSTGLAAAFSLAYAQQIIVYTPALTGPALTVAGATLAVTIIGTLTGVRNARMRMEMDAHERGMSYAMISGVQKLRLSGSEKRAYSRWMQLYAQKAKYTYAPPVFLLLTGSITTMISLIGTVVMYWRAAQSGVSVSDYYAFTVAYGMLTGAFAALSEISSSIADIKPAWDMAKPILKTVPEIGQERKIVTRLTGTIELTNVCFRYNENGPNIADHLSLKIQPGQYIAVVGKTGCGKSTLVRLLLGFEKPQMGAIYYDGQDLAALDPRSVRRKIGAVTQNGKLFTGSIYSNIVISAPWLTLDDAWAAAEISGIAEDIRAMPMGMHTQIGEGVGGFSGGQKQRLMIARAVAPKPKILILDEATSALDNITQRQVSEALDKLKCTRIVIAHRLSTIRQCDRIIVLDGGKIVEDGTYEELIARGGFFAELVERQRLDT